MIIKRRLNDELINKLQNDETFKVLWQLIVCDETLCPVFRNDKIDIYYRGYKLFSISCEGILRNKKTFNNKIIDYNNHEYHGLNGNILHLEDNPTFEDFPYILPFYKQNVDYWFGAGTKHAYEREFQQLMFRENNSKKFGKYSDYYILEMEYQYRTSGPEPDLMAVKMPRRKRQGTTYRLAIVEVKYLDDSFARKAGIRSHIDDYIKLVNNKDMLNEVKNEMEIFFTQRKELGLLQGYNSDKKQIKISDEKPELILALIGLNSNNGKNNHDKEVETLKKILTDALDCYGSELLDAVYIAQTSEMGFGLYEDKMIKIADYKETL